MEEPPVIFCPSRVIAAATVRWRLAGAPWSNSFQKTDQPPDSKSLRPSIVSSRADRRHALGAGRRAKPGRRR